MKKKIKESPPQHEFYKMLKAFLEYDPTVEVGELYEQKAAHIKFDIKIYDSKKYFAFEHLLRLHDNFAGLEYTINLVPANDAVAKKAAKLNAKNVDFGSSLPKVLKDFFDGNKAFSQVKVVKNYMSQSRDVFCILKPEIVQYWADNIGSAYGLNTETYEEVAKKVFVDDLRFFVCTERIEAKEPNPCYEIREADFESLKYRETCDVDSIYELTFADGDKMTLSVRDIWEPESADGKEPERMAEVSELWIFNDDGDDEFVCELSNKMIRNADGTRIFTDKLFALVKIAIAAHLNGDRD